jgi:Predicted amino acid racemase
MTAPRLEINLERIQHNAETLVRRLGARGIAVTGVTKANLGSPEIAQALVRGGVAGLGDSRIENIEALRDAGLTEPMTLIRSPMLSQCDRVVASADLSLNTELGVVAALSVAASAQARTHGVVLMVELGDLREGILPADLQDVAREVLRLPGVALRGIGTNLACQSGAAPDAQKMAQLSELAASIETALGVNLDVISGGNSANLEWAFASEEVGRINDLRLGESILLGCETLHRHPIEGLHPDAITLVAEVIEAKVKPTKPWGAMHQAAFGDLEPSVDRGVTGRVLVAIGEQDTDPSGLEPPLGYTILGASSDHLVLDAGSSLPPIGTELRFTLNYSALLRAMTSPFVARAWL